jgi:hypothetical protein
MRYIITISFLLLTIFAFAQKNDRFSLVVQMQPELAWYKNDYAFIGTEKKTISSTNIGFTASLQYNPGKRFFADLGVGFISRKFNTAIITDPSIYSDRNIMLLEIFVTQSITSRILQLPLGVGYHLISTPKIGWFVKSSYVPNFILNTKYQIPNHTAVKKDGGSGYSINLGTGLDYSISKKIALTGLLSYAVKNSVQQVQHSYNQGPYNVAITYNYLQLGLGVKVKL